MKTSKNIPILLCLTGFFIITYYVTLGTPLAIDQTIQGLVFSLRTPWLDTFFRLLTHTGDWQVIFVIALLFLVSPRTRKHYGLPMAGSALLSTSLYEILKYIFQRPRPDAAFHLISQGGYSFPSGHSLTSLVFYGVFLILLFQNCPKEKKTATRMVAVLLGLYILLMGFSRIYVGVHYPTDVLGSWLLGTCLLLYLGNFRTLFSRGIL